MSTIEEIEDRQYKFKCGHRCGQTWSGTSLKRLAKRIAWHWNEEHHDELRISMTQIDEVERGGHHVHGNEYTVERIPIYVTAFDVLEELPTPEIYVDLPDDRKVCHRCFRVLKHTDKRVEIDTSGLNDKWRCAQCDEEMDIERRREENQSIVEFNA
jgi:predicted small metal-binding protein